MGTGGGTGQAQEAGHGRHRGQDRMRAGSGVGQGLPDMAIICCIYFVFSNFTILLLCLNLV